MILPDWWELLILAALCCGVFQVVVGVTRYSLHEPHPLAHLLVGLGLLALALIATLALAP